MLEFRGFRNLEPHLAELGNELMSILIQSLCAFCLTVGHMLKSLPIIPYNVLFHLGRFHKSFKYANRRKASSWCLHC